MSRSRLGEKTQFMFLPGERGTLFAAYYPHRHDLACQGGVLYIHPFAEEMNKGRRMAALQARALANGGFDVLTVDLYGCGDSEGDFGDGEWDLWLKDLEACRDWLASRAEGPVYLWGLRLGCLLALDLASSVEADVSKVILWQPVISGQMMLTQFLRQMLAAEMMRGGDRITTTQLRDRLASGESIEISGYQISPSLARAIDAASLAAYQRTDHDIYWLEVARESDRPLTPAGKRVIETWQDKAITVRTRVVAGEPFWSSVEITDCPALIEQTTDMVFS